MRDRHRANSCTLCYSIYLFPILVSKDIEMKDKSVKPSGWWQKSHFHKTTAAWDKEQIQTLLFKVIHQTMSGLYVKIGMIPSCYFFTFSITLFSTSYRLLSRSIVKLCTITLLVKTIGMENSMYSEKIICLLFKSIGLLLKRITMLLFNLTTIQSKANKRILEQLYNVKECVRD